MSMMRTDWREYGSMIDQKVLVACLMWISILITLNYTLGIEPKWIRNMASRLDQFGALYVMYCSAFIIPYGFVMLLRKQVMVVTPGLWGLLLITPAIFALKVCSANPLEYVIDGVWGLYWVIVTMLPFKLLIVMIPLMILYAVIPQSSFWGMTVNNVHWQPYSLMLLLMLPLILFASTQPDFLETYPRVRQIDFIAPYTDCLLCHRLLYEFSYGIDFITIELFFRGFLIFGFIRYAGAAVIVPMATFYCSIHFGKPLFECISSFFGGLILGVIAYRTRSIVGGLAVHVGIAWMMEVGGFLGNIWSK
ncbi:CPBP family intramembrane metalloprotease [Nitrosomonas sp. JL21]|nr:CPBP family intramembrane metalloprotease [Nitrosomonas sp.]MXS77718.1 CPBP family intramembrane metalloprotease [Nitrosomonas sp. JL21]